MPFRTQAQVDRLLRQSKPGERWEYDELTTGLALRFQGRRAAWYACLPRTADGKRPKVHLGDASMKLEEARDQARPMIRAAKDGRDVRAERRAAREAAKTKSADTLGRLIGLYLERHAQPNMRARSYAECSRILLKTWAPLHHMPVDSVGRRDIADHLERIRTERGPSAAQSAHSYLRAAFVWALKAGFADQNPVALAPEPETPPSRARALDPAELVQIWEACEDIGDFGRIVRLLLLTGQRRNEVAGMCWSEIDLHRKLWIIPAARAKNGREHEVPLTALAMSLLPDRRLGRDLLFGRRDDAFSGFSQSKAKLGEKLDGLTPWRLHDCRHAFITCCAEIGIEPHIIEALVNHQSGHKGGIAGRYNAAQYREPKRKAMERFSQWLEEKITGEQQTNVVAFG